MAKIFTSVTVALFIVAIGVSTVYAENEKNVFEGVEPECTEIHTAETINGTVIEHHLLDCKWYAIDMATAIQEDLTDEEQEVIDKAKECREDSNCEQPTINLDYLSEDYGGIPKTVSSDVVPESCTRTNPSPSDIEECNIDTKMSFCERGIQSTSPIQQYEYFAVTEYTPRDDLQIDLNTGATSIANKLKDYEECRAELGLIIDLNKTHYVGIAKQVAKGEYNPYHADFVTSDFVFPAGETEATESEIVFAERRAHDTFCAIEYIQESVRVEQGCEPKKYEGTYKNLTGITAYEAKLRDQGPLAEKAKYDETDGVGYVPHWIKKHSFGISSINTSSTDTQWQFKATLED
jgi:hypothetical protein